MALERLSLLANSEGMMNAHSKFALPDSSLDFDRIDVCGVVAERLKMGQGRPLLFLHDGGGLEYSDEFLTLLAQDFEVHALSHPGFGNTDLPEHFCTVEDIVYFYLDYIETENLSDIVLVGAQFGGWIAAELAVSGTSRFSALVLIDANGIKVGPRDRIDVIDIFYMVPEEIRALGWHKARPAREALTEEGALRLARNRESLALFGWSPLLHNRQLSYRLHRIKVPALVLWGESDRLTPVEYGRAYAAAIPGARFRLILEAGHLPHVEQSLATATEVRQFIDACRNPRG